MIPLRRAIQITEPGKEYPENTHPVNGEKAPYTPKTAPSGTNVVSSGSSGSCVDEFRIGHGLQDGT